MRICDWSSDVCSSDLERGITLDRIDQTRRCRTAGLGIETPQCDILFGDIDRACRIVGDAAFGLRPELEIADLAQRSLAAGPCDDLPLAVDPVGIAREDEGPPIPGAAIHAQPIGIGQAGWLDAIGDFDELARLGEIGRASCRERVCQYV